MTRKPKALIVDDELHVRKLMLNVMTAIDTEVVGEARNGDEAVLLFKVHHPDIVLLDVNMPGKDGQEALEEILRENPRAAVIMLTSMADLETVKKCLNAGAANYLLKNTPIEEWKTLIKETWADHQKKPG